MANDNVSNTDGFFFPGSVHSGTIIRALPSFANRYKNIYITIQNVWINKRYFEISNSKEKQCLIVDTRSINNLGPGKFRTQADSSMRHICYYNRNKPHTSFNLFWQQQNKHLEKVR